MGSSNGAGRSALAGVLSLSFWGGTAPAQENAGAMDGVADLRAIDPFPDGARTMLAGGLQLHGHAGSRLFDWGTGGFEVRGERLKSGSRSIDTVNVGSRWQRTYAVDASFWESATPDIVFEAGARLARTNRGVAGGPLPASPTETVAQMAYVGARISDSASIRFIGFDEGGWSEGAAGELAGRIANGEPAARKGTAVEISSSRVQPGRARWDPRFKLRVERGRTAARSDTAATLSWKVRL